MVGLPEIPRAAPSAQATKWFTTSNLVQPRAGNTTLSGELILMLSPPTVTVVSLLTGRKLADGPTLIRRQWQRQLEHVSIVQTSEGEVAAHQPGQCQ